MEGGDQVKDRPILFSGPMVRAIREGRKTQTRRLVKLPVKDPTTGGEVAGCELNGFLRNGEPVCPYGQPGDRLWVRETWNAWRQCNLEYNEWDTCDCAPSEIPQRYGAVKLEYAATSESIGPWRPSIHMPRWASRIALEIVSVRVERLKDISEDDANAEGAEFGFWHQNEGVFAEPVDEEDDQNSCFRDGFGFLWESINGPGSWDLNPWVWVVEFKEVKP